MAVTSKLSCTMTTQFPTQPRASPRPGDPGTTVCMGNWAIPVKSGPKKKIVRASAQREPFSIPFDRTISRIMFFYLLAVQGVLKQWKRNPSASKMEIGIWRHWHDPIAENRLPLSAAEVERMKQFLEQHGPISYRELFAK